MYKTKTRNQSKRVLTYTADWEESGFKSEKSYANYLKNIEDNPTIPVKSDFTETVFETVLTSEGFRNVKQVRVRRSGDPALGYAPKHQVDAGWFYPVISRNPEESAGVSLAEYTAAGGNKNHRFYPAPSLASPKS